jgi:Flp pilus assembly protein TadG
VIHLRNRSRRPERRKGAALTEFAICVPVLAIFLYGTMEVCEMIYLRNALTLSAYEGARLACRRDATATMATQRAQQICTAQQVNSPTITISPTNITSAAVGTRITVTVAAGWNANSITRFVLSSNYTFSVSSTMVRE